MPTQKINETQIRERIQEHLTTLKIPMTMEGLDEVLHDATRKKPGYLQLLEQFLAKSAIQAQWNPSIGNSTPKRSIPLRSGN
jgi:hypothetical protein